MKIYTKSGDTGTTSLLSGKRVSKSHERIEAYGNIDELNGYIGYLAETKINENRKTFLRNIQKNLFVIGSALASGEDHSKINIPEIYDKEVKKLEKEIDALDETLAPLKNFILPGGNQDICFAHIARTICRRAERSTVRLGEHEDVPQIIITFLNRLSDYLFILSRKMASDYNTEEVKWIPE